MNNIKLIEVPSEIGAGTRGASLGIDAIKIAGLDFMSNFFVHFPSERIESENNLLFEPIQSPYAKRIHGVLNMYERISKSVSDCMGSNNKLFSDSILSEGKWTKKLLIKSNPAILMASMPKLAPLVPAPISDGTSINLILFINYFLSLIFKSTIFF